MFIRNIIVGRNGIVRDNLVYAFSEQGAEGVQSVLSTGNVIFDAEPSKVEGIVSGAQQTLRETLGLEEPFFTRSFARLLTLSDLLPFGSKRFATAHERCLTFLSTGSQIPEPLPFRTQRKDLEVLVAHDLDVFSATWLVGNRPGQPGKWIEKQTGSPATTRNWNTIARLLAR